MTGAFINSKRRHLPELAGLRAVAALGIVVTHVAFQTGTESALFARFDYFVSVFFALSAFLLARGQGRPQHYFTKRVARIAPAYLVCVTVVLLALPELADVTWPQAVANLLMIQIYVPDGLIAGLTQLWSLCVEVAFYLVLPAYLALGRRGRAAALIVGTCLALAWPWLPFVRDSIDAWGVNLQIWPISYVPWFAVGLICAEVEPRVSTRAQRVLRPRWVYWVLALVVAWFAGLEAVGPMGLEHPSPAEFNVRVLLGTLFCALVLVPYALAPSDSGVLASPVMQALGRWSYSIFLWHVAVLAVVFPLLGIPVFSGGFFPVLAATVAISIAVSYISFELVEVPGARLVRAIRATRTTAPATDTAAESPA
ncbi:acyltransferase family protein [Corynebacterium pilosum]|uniref:Predicted acyltransferase n=1 Tax=Corynebacterium pilosum TaxID=35756 RepID=A0A376CKH7_9CORY|nr:acyltransferase [Corynebacterium pilosum]STC68996.1 predicted acyltransferase [Corynebacterium pilosum]